MLLRFQKQNLIQSSSSSTDSEDIDNHVTKLMESKNPQVRLMIYSKLKKMVTSLKGKKLKPYQQKLIRGIFKNKIKDFDENGKEELKRVDEKQPGLKLSDHLDIGKDSRKQSMKTDEDNQQASIGNLKKHKHNFNEQTT